MSYNLIINGYTRAIEMNFNKNTYLEIPKSIISNDRMLNRKDEFVTPSKISNTIIRIGDDKFLMLHIDKIFKYLEALLCKFIVIIFEGFVTIEDLTILFNTVNKYNIHEVTLLLNYSDELYSDDFADVVLSSNRFKSIIIFNSPFDKNLENYIYYYRRQRNTNKFNKSYSEFVPNIELYAESLNYHSYFNKKLFIDTKGEIKNAPESSEMFGLINDYKSSEDLIRVIDSKEFQRYWHVKKDKCDICKDCEYRYMCVDNRLPYYRSNGEWYHKIECNYNPYICKWESEKAYKTLKECGVISSENGFSINYKKIETINEELWGC